MQNLLCKSCMGCHVCFYFPRLTWKWTCIQFQPHSPRAKRQSFHFSEFLIDTGSIACDRIIEESEQLHDWERERAAIVHVESSEAIAAVASNSCPSMLEALALFCAELVAVWKWLPTPIWCPQLVFFN
jgi:hypothetical protein